MRFRSFAVAGLALSVASVAGAQTPSPQCPGGIPGTAAQITQDACQQTVDLFNYMLPQLGVSLTGGNTTLAQGGSLGGFGHFAIGVRGNLLQGSVPVPQTVATTGAVARSTYPTDDQFLGLPAVDAAVGVFKGFPLALSNVGGVDLLLSANYVPKLTIDEVSVAPKTNLQLGYGARLGILQESLLLPGIGVSIMQRNLPKTTIVGVLTDDSLSIQDLDIKTTAWRVTASKSLVLFSIAAGVGQDIYDASTTITATVNEPFPINRQTTSASLKEKVTRTNFFADLSMNLMVMKIVGSVGMVTGGDLPTFNTFDTAADASRLYGSLGLRFGF